MRDLLDASVWLPLSAPDHVHHARARQYWDQEAAEELVFCRLTALALLRYLTNKRLLGDRALSSAESWRALGAWLSLPNIKLVDEPLGVNEYLGRWSQELNLGAGAWTDAYLAAFAAAGDCRLIAFDGDFERYEGIKFLHLKK